MTSPTNDPTAKKIRCGVIGAGWWGTYAHVPAFLEHPRAELVAIQNKDPETASRIARDFHVRAACTTAGELLDIPEIEAVAISSTPNLHYEQALASLRSGRHVLLEKPMTITAGQSRKLVAVAREKHLQFLISAPWHYTRHARLSRKLIEEGELGRLRMISVLMTNVVSDLVRGATTRPTHGKPYIDPEPGSWSDPRIAGGGQIYAQVPHVAAYLTFLTGAWPREVFARFDNDGSNVDIYDTLSIKMDDGTMVSLATTGATSLERKDFEIRVFGTRGILYLELWQGKMELLRFSNGIERFPDLAPDEIYPDRAPALNLIDSIIGSAPNGSPAILGLAAMEVVEAACRSAADHSNIEIPPPENSQKPIAG